MKKQPWHWDSIHQIAFDNVKTTIAKEVVLAYPDFTKSFEAMPSQSGFMGIKVECQFRFSKNRQHSRQNIQIELV